MELQQWFELIAFMRAMWPHSKPLDKAAVKVQYEFVKNTPYDLALGAVKALAAESFPPNSATIAQKATELALGPPVDFDQVVAAFRGVLRKGGGRWDVNNRPPIHAWAGVPQIILDFFDVARWRQWCLAHDDDRTFYAQQRDEFKSARVRFERERNLLSAGVDRKVLRRKEGAAPRQLDPASAFGMQRPALEEGAA